MRHCGMYSLLHSFHTLIFDAVRDLFQESEFNSAITISTNDTKKVTYRFERVHSLFAEIFA